MTECKTKGCGSYALNEHPESGLCDVCYWKDQSEQATRLERERCLRICEELKTMSEYSTLRISVDSAIQTVMERISEVEL